MPNKYYDTISKIKADDDFKEKLIANLVEENQRMKVVESQKMNIEENERKYVKKEGDNNENEKSDNDYHINISHTCR